MAVIRLDTTPVSSIGFNSAYSGGNIITNGINPVLARGVCFDTTPLPVLSLFTTDGTGDGIYTSALGSLSDNTKYYYRSYVTTADGTFYGGELSFTTLALATTTITFPVQKVNDTEEIQLIMVFKHSTGTTSSVTSESLNLLVERWNNIKSSYDIEDALLVLSNVSLEIGDPLGNLDNLFFGQDTFNLSVVKTANVTVILNGIPYEGYITEDSINSNEGSLIVSFDAKPNTDVLNKRMVYGKNGTDTVWADSNSYTAGQHVPIKDLLTTMYKLVNNNIISDNITLIHDWIFQGVAETGEMTGNPAFLNDIAFEDLSIMVDYLCLNNNYGISTIGDILRKFALDWCSFTGMTGNSNIFFKKIFHYNSNNLQTLTVLNREKGYKYGLLDYVCINPMTALSIPIFEKGTYTNLEGRFLKRDTLTGFGTDTTYYGTIVKAIIDRPNYFRFQIGSGIISPYPNENDHFTNNGSTFRVAGTPFDSDFSTFTSQCVIMERISGTNDPSASGTLTQTVGTSGNLGFDSWSSANDTYNIYRAKDVNLLNNVFSNYGDLLSEFWWNFRGNIQNCRVDKFTLLGCAYDFLKDFVYLTSKYQIISLTLYPSEGYSECEAIYMGEV